MEKNGKVVVIRPYVKPPMQGSLLRQTIFRGDYNEMRDKYGKGSSPVFRINDRNLLNDSQTIFETGPETKVLRFSSSVRNALIYLPPFAKGTIKIIEKRSLTNVVKGVEFESDFEITVKKA